MVSGLGQTLLNAHQKSLPTMNSANDRISSTAPAATAPAFASESRADIANP